jgi:hypothetical protein
MMNTFGRKLGFPSRGMIEPPNRVSAEVVAEKILEFLGTGKSCKLEEIARAVYSKGRYFLPRAPQCPMSSFPPPDRSISPSPQL